MYFNNKDTCCDLTCLLHVLHMMDEETEHSMESTASLTSYIQPLMDYVADYINRKLVKPSTDVLKKGQENMETDLQQMKSYVLALEERIVSLEDDIKTHNENFEQVGIALADVSASNKQLMETSKTKKKHFWRGA